MNAGLDDKSRLIVGSLVVAILLAGGYVLYQQMNPSSVPPPPTQAAADTPSQPQIQPSGPGAPSVKLEAEAQVVAGSNGHQASIVSEGGLQYAWSIQGGTLDGATNNPVVTWNAGNGREATLTCRISDSTGRSTVASQRVVLLQSPVIQQFEAAPGVVTVGTACRLSWVVTNAEKLTLNPGGQELPGTGSPSLEVKPQETTKYVLTATNATGVPTTREVQVKVVGMPDIVGFQSTPEPGSDATVTVTCQFKNGKAELKDGDQVLASGDASPLTFRWTGAKDGATLTLKVTNEAGSFVSSTLSFKRQRK